MVYALLIPLILFLVALYVLRAVKLPDNVDQVIEEVLSKEAPELHTGQTGFAKNGDIELFYESLGDPSNETIFLIMGHSAPAIFWPSYLVEPLVAAGYHVLRMDNRGVGKSSWVKDWANGKKYSLEQMAEDSLAVLDHLNIPKAHLVGCSMGGMISQRIAISHAERVQSLSLVMSTGYFFDPSLKGLTPSMIIDFLRVGIRWASLKDHKKFLKYSIGIAAVLHSKPSEIKEVREIAGNAHFILNKTNGVNTLTRKQHSYAIKKSGSRLEELHKINVPTVVLHGTDDPLILPSHAKKYQPLIPNSKLVWMEGCGHYLPKTACKTIVAETIANIQTLKTVSA